MGAIEQVHGGDRGRERLYEDEGWLGWVCGARYPSPLPPFLQLVEPQGAGCYHRSRQGRQAARGGHAAARQEGGAGVCGGETDGGEG